MIMFFAVVGLRLVQIQIIEFPKYREIAQKQYQSKIVLPAARGTLYDRSGNVIATNSIYVSFAADPQLAVADARAIASKFSNLFGKPKSYYLEKLRSDSRFVWLERQVDVRYLKKINTKDLEGIVVRYEPKRLYFHDQVAGQLVGCTDVDNNGLAGIELSYDKELRGIDGYVIFQRDGLGRARPSVDYPRVEPVNGHNIILTIDMGLQAIAEKELRKGIEQNKADHGLVVVIQPKTGEVLTMAQYPNVDPNKFGTFDLQDQKLRAVTDVFEPGSVFKIVTASAALDHGIVVPEKRFFAENGKYVVPVSYGKQRTIADTHPEGWLTFQEAMEVSSNIVMAKVSDLIGPERFYKMARDYGFGIATNIDFPGEAKGVLKKPIEWSGTTLNTIAYGYEVGVTPIQIVAAYAVVANDGILMQPYLFKRETDGSGQIVREGKSQQIRRVISPATARILKNFFEGVVVHGTGVPAQIAGVKVAGKTGTSRKYIEGHYETGSYTASFVGFLPVDDPQLVCLVMMDNPRGSSYYGGTVSAPVFRAIAERFMNTSQMFVPQDTMGAVTTNGGNTVRSSKRIQTERAVDEKERNVGYPKGIVPDVKGYSVRRAVGILMTGKFQPIVNGSGTVINQVPPAGQPARPGTKITLICQPRSSVALNIN
ncbi:MAG: PASTA domain-containing protein [Ignavibacteria bacterium]|nr:PASTA domain-containing protein [Ignavibacteria bacterium]